MLIILSNWIFCGLIGYFNTNLWEYKVLYPDETSDYIPKNDFDGVQVILLQVNF